MAAALSILPASAQTIYLAPSGGITIKKVLASKNGWAFVTFVEPFSELGPCGTYTSTPVAHYNPVWIDLTGAAVSGKQLSAAVSSAHLTGKKVDEITVNVNGGGTWCEMVNVWIDG
jgi:hypothetical protein